MRASTFFVWKNKVYQSHFSCSFLDKIQLELRPFQREKNLMRLLTKKNDCSENTYRVLAFVVLIVMTGITVLPNSAAAHANSEHPVTFTKDVAPILPRSCQGCHRPNSVAPMSLLTYEEVRPWARAIKDKVYRTANDPERRPPWFF